MKYKAVIFDLFGTLTDHHPVREYNRALSRMAAAVSVPRHDFWRVWRETHGQRTTGSFATVEASIEHICRVLGAPSRAAGISTAARIRTDCLRLQLRLRPDAVETLAHLKEAGYKIGVISNCPPGTPELWRELPVAPLVDVAILSCQVGLKKPDARIYQLACERLAVNPQDCLYVGDGAGGELPGASQVGMHPVRIHVTDDEGVLFYPDATVKEWQGPAIAALRDALRILGS